LWVIGSTGFAYGQPHKRHREISEISVAQVSASRIALVRVLRAVQRVSHDRSADQGNIRGIAERAARAYSLPSDFFLHLIKQESAFDPNAVSIQGAQGIAQFMPNTAAERGLKNPFDPDEALFKSAELLKELKNRFGN
jgi:soluble lytic murein transglycosylase-like protein